MKPQDVHETVIDGARICWRERGSGPCVVLVHGSPISSWSFRLVLSELSDRFRVVAPDLPGFGRSDKPNDGLGFTSISVLLSGFLREVAGDAYALLGHDWGGPIALAAANPEAVTDLILANTTFRPDFAPPRYWLPFTAPYSGEALVVSADLFGRGLPLLLSAARQDRELVDEYRRSTVARGARRTMLRLERQEGWAEVTSTARAWIAERRPRTLLLWGDPDPYFRSDELTWLRKEIPWAELCRLPGGGHFPQEDAPRAFARGLRGFLLRGAASMERSRTLV
ncbi:MAG: alpha/beta fold hydrolase [Myxococcales bacterium]|nr:alpha/beta fold hydrolase [Myxococcales bacterium]